MENYKVGFIGVGTMGKGMINNLKKKYAVTVYNRTRARAEELGGVTVVDTPKEVVDKVDIVIVCISNDDALKSVLFEENGIFAGKIENKILVDSGTTSIELTRKMFQEAEKGKMNFLDAPVTGSKNGAENGTMTIMVGGEKNIFNKMLPVFEAMGKCVVYCGVNTMGQSAKHALNMTMSLILESYLEGLAMGIKAGVPREAMQEILDNSGAKNGMGTIKMPYIIDRDFDPHFLLGLMYKDLNFADADRKKLVMYAPLADVITKVFADAMERSDEDICTIAKTLEEKNNISFL